MKKSIILLISFMIIGKCLFAVPAYPYPVTYTQPNGDTLTIVMQGDEFLKFARTEDYYTLLYDANGFFCYAQQNENGDIEPSPYIAKSKNLRTAEEVRFLGTITPKLFYSKAQMNILSQIRNIREKERGEEKGFPTTGERKTLCILIGFTDKLFTRTQAEFNNLFNQVNYNFQGANGSFKDYYLEASYNQLSITTDIAGPFTASQNMAYYGANDQNGNDLRPSELAMEACSLAYNSGVNFSLYDNDKDGEMDAMYIIYAGYGEDGGGGANAIWAHAWVFQSPIYFNGVKIQRYACSAELRGTSGNDITYIGVICHEFGHVLGAPDYYDTNYGTGGEYEGTAYWDLQAAGSWNGGGKTPAHPNPRSKVYTYQWATVTELNGSTTINLPPSIDNKTAFYRINTTTNNEYFILENRQKKKFDAEIPGHGLVIYRCHANIDNGANNNTVNATHPQQFYIVAANTTSQLPNSNASSYGSTSSTSCAWPGTLNKIQFSDATTPSMKSWAGANTNIPISNISENNATGYITFEVGSSCASVSNLTVNYTGGCEAQLSWTAGTAKVLSNNNDNIEESIEEDLYRKPFIPKSTTLTPAFANQAKPALPLITLVEPQRGEQWLKWCGANVDAVGSTNGNSCEFVVAARFTPSDLSAIGIKTGDVISKIKFVPWWSSYSYFTIGIYSGGTSPSNPGTLDYQQAVTQNLTDYIYNDVSLATPYIINTSKEMWIAYYVYTYYGFPAGCDAGPRVPDKGDIINWGGTWSSLYALSGGSYNANWNIEALVTSTIVEPTTYNIYRDGARIASNIAQTYYLDNGFSPYEKHTWSVKSVVNGSENCASNASKESCTVSIEENIKNSLSVFPNPASSQITITTNKSFHTVKVMNIVGQTVMEQPNSGNKMVLNVAHLTKGIYFVCIVSEEGRNVVKFMKQ